jgi:threonine dehydrogenase-like Zn-dependent dehydrogenase
MADIPRPTPAAGEVLLDVAFCGICGSDLHMLGHPQIPTGFVMGHEFSGCIVETGTGVDGWSVGDRVAVIPTVPCGACPPCQAGQPNLCGVGLTTGPGLGQPGAYAEAVVVSTRMLRRLPETVSDAAGALAEPLAVALRGIDLAEVTPEDGVVVLGGGPIGVLTAVALRARGVGRLILVEPVADRRMLVDNLGFQTAVPEGVAALATDAFEAPPSVVIDCSGHPAGAALAIEMLAPAGRLLLVGVPYELASLDLALITTKEIVVRGSLAYTAEQFDDALELLAAGAVPSEQIVTTVAELEDTPSWFAELTSGATRQVKVLLQPGNQSRT